MRQCGREQRRGREDGEREGREREESRPHVSMSWQPAQSPGPMEMFPFLVKSEGRIRTFTQKRLLMRFREEVVPGGNVLKAPETEAWPHEEEGGQGRKGGEEGVRPASKSP